MQFLTQCPRPSPLVRALLQSIEEELRPDTSDTETSRPSITASPAGPILVAASPAVSAPVEETADPKAAPRPSPSTTRIPAGRGKNVNSRHFRRPRLRPTPASGRERTSRAASSSGFTAKSRSTESSRRLDRAGLAMGASVNARSVGTVVAHFPTAVAARLAARGKKATKRAWG